MLSCAWIQPATELIKEIAALELEVVYLEQYLLSLYRKAFDQQVISVSPIAKDEKLNSPLETPRGRLLKVPKPIGVTSTTRRLSQAVISGCQQPETPSIKPNIFSVDEHLLDSGVQRCHSSLSQFSAVAARVCPPDDSLDNAVRACQSQPSSLMEVHDLCFLSCILNWSLWQCYKATNMMVKGRIGMLV